MRIGAFQINEPMPELHQPHALAMLSPWIDVGGVGSTTMQLLQNHLNAKPLGSLLRPGNLFDFTRYRPTIRFVEEHRVLEIPNSYIYYAKQPGGTDLLFFHLLEPHMMGEVYVDSVLRILQKLDVKRYCLIGSMYDAVPHTKPLIMSGRTSGKEKEELHKLGVQSSDYEGPTTIAYLISTEAPAYNIESMSLVVHLPQYVRLDKDYAGTLRLTELLCSIYQIPLDLGKVKRQAEKQNEELDLAMNSNAQLKEAIQQLERYYESKVQETEKEHAGLAPEVEEFLRDVMKRFGQN